MQSYRISKPRIVYEVLNTEVIAIDFNTGTYYALLNVAKQVWILIEKHIPVQQIATLIANHYKRDPKEVLAEVQSFIDQLLEGGLIESSDEPALELAEINSYGAVYEPPKLLTYMDVQDLLLIDPIHEVAEVGWPDTK